MTIDEPALQVREAGLAGKAEDIAILNLSRVSLIADYFVIMTGRSKTHVQAISDHVEEKLAETNVFRLGREGYADGQWVLLDFGSLVVHIFQKEAREFYNLERLWGDARAVEL